MKFYNLGARFYRNLSHFNMRAAVFVVYKTMQSDQRLCYLLQGKL